jgi:hypothetical protein
MGGGLRQVQAGPAPGTESETGTGGHRSETGTKYQHAGDRVSLRMPPGLKDLT